MFSTQYQKNCDVAGTFYCNRGETSKSDDHWSGQRWPKLSKSTHYCMNTFLKLFICCAVLNYIITASVFIGTVKVGFNYSFFQKNQIFPIY